LLLAGSHEAVRRVAAELARQGRGPGFAACRCGWMRPAANAMKCGPCCSVLQFPDPRLRERHSRVAQIEIDDALRKLAADMAETMYDEPGIGLPRHRSASRSA
jgi:hypothetical protein